MPDAGSERRHGAGGFVVLALTKDTGTQWRGTSISHQIPILEFLTSSEIHTVNKTTVRFMQLILWKFEENSVTSVSAGFYAAPWLLIKLQYYYVGKALKAVGLNVFTVRSEREVEELKVPCEGEEFTHDMRWLRTRNHIQRLALYYLIWLNNNPCSRNSHTHFRNSGQSPYRVRTITNSDILISFFKKV